MQHPTIQPTQTFTGTLATPIKIHSAPQIPHSQAQTKQSNSSQHQPPYNTLNKVDNSQSIFYQTHPHRPPLQRTCTHKHSQNFITLNNQTQPKSLYKHDSTLNDSLVQHVHHKYIQLPSTTSNILNTHTPNYTTTIHISHIHDCGGCGWKDVGMVATHCAVMCGLSVHALRCALSLVSLVFGELFFGESPSLHDLFLHFLANSH